MAHYWIGLTALGGLVAAWLLFGLLAGLVLLLLPWIAAWAVARFYLQGPDLGRYDTPREPPCGERAEVSPEHARVVAELGELHRALEQVPRRERLATLRDQLDQGFGSHNPPSAEIVPVEVEGRPAEWVIAPGAQPERRLLYLHGGAFMLGSPKSHRGITAMMSQVARAAVLAIDYRLLPEHRRRDGIADCQRAYRWILEHGPAGTGEPEALFVAGDSAGGNLTLMLVAWARDRGLRAADGAIALSPGTDSTFGSPSLRSNLATDPMLGPALGKLLRVPRPALLWFGWLTNRIRPCDPLISPVFGDLSGLPPVLVHASESEMLRDDARRWVNKARAAGSPATLETWEGLVHVWHAFAPDVPEAKEAYERIGVFVDRCRVEAG